jgi:AraC-like DNA-binding protein
MTKVPEAALRVEAGEDLLTLYEWNTKRAKHYFCSRCGIYVFHRKRAAPDHFGINIFCLDGFDVSSLPVRETDGVEMSLVAEGRRREWSGPDEVLARQAGMSERNFGRVFVEKTGLTPGRFVEYVRLDRAKLYLETTGWPLARVAEKSGFGGVTSLIRSFSKHLQITPHAYRQRFTLN